MLLNEVIHGEIKPTHPIGKECSVFLNESQGQPILKNLPSNYEDFHKVKLRQRKKRDEFYKTFNEVFDDVPNLRQRSITVNGETTFCAENGKMEPFFIFPIDGYKFMYSLEVTNSKQDYKDAFEKIVETFQDTEIVQDLLKYTYTTKNLIEGIERGSEIIIYNIPYCYAVRANVDYTSFLEQL